MSNTPRTDRYELYYIETSNVSKLFVLARELENELNDAKETIDMMETRHGATMLCHQAQMDVVTNQRDALAGALQGYLTSTESGGAMQEMAKLSGRLLFYERLRECRKIAEQALAATKGGAA